MANGPSTQSFHDRLTWVIYVWAMAGVERTSSAPRETNARFMGPPITSRGSRRVRMLAPIPAPPPLKSAAQTHEGLRPFPSGGPVKQHPADAPGFERV